MRVFAAGAWTPWMPYGKWSPFLRRASLPVQHPEDAAAYLDTDMVNVRAPGGASLFQLRASLYTDDVRRSPSVYLLAASVRPTGWQRETGEALQHRCVPVPAYSQLIRDPRIGSVICSPTTVTMLMNRWGGPAARRGGPRQLRLYIRGQRQLEFYHRHCGLLRI